jgi:hypothetical protein
MMTEEPARTDLVPLDKVNVENAAAVTSGFFGLVIGGPLGAALFAAVAKYVSKKDNEGGEALRGVGKTVVEVYNYLTKLNSKYKLIDYATETVSKVTSSVETPEGISSVTKTTAEVVEKIKGINSEYDLISKGKQALEVATTLSDSAFEKLEELNAKVCVLFNGSPYFNNFCLSSTISLRPVRRLLMSPSRRSRTNSTRSKVLSR